VTTDQTFFDVMHPLTERNLSQNVLKCRKRQISSYLILGDFFLMYRKNKNQFRDSNRSRVVGHPKRTSVRQEIECLFPFF
jgi:hypothetical protein